MESVTAVALSPPRGTSFTATWSPVTWSASLGLAVRSTPQDQVFLNYPFPLETLGVVLKCQVCGHNSDSPAHLQQHVRTHLEVRVPAERSPTPRQSTPSSFDHPQPSPQEREPLACVPKPESSSPGANGGSATPRDYSSPDSHSTELRIKEEPQSEPRLKSVA
ncbi:hypothetical protein FQA47_013649 [Oryzias melastigma]|uniref:C2H2-type domain-containing protein n=1 Tax=Oryzias melastigma TaxID=30732 RepID=A0A834F2I9_ORYME|nr:hypothetical protein FQA47_013649 [Oryzias melastigma]